MFGGHMPAGQSACGWLRPASMPMQARLCNQLRYLMLELSSAVPHLHRLQSSQQALRMGRSSRLYHSPRMGFRASVASCNTQGSRGAWD